MGLGGFRLRLLDALATVQNEDDYDADQYHADDKPDDDQDELPVNWNQR